MQTVVKQFEQKYRKPAIVDVKSGDTVRVSQKIREAGKERTQIFEGMVIRTKRMGSVSASITVRKIASGVGVEKSYLLHSPNVTKVQVVRRGKVRRNFLTYIRERQGKSMRLQEQAFDSDKVNIKDEPKAEQTEDAAKAAELDKQEAEAEKPSKKDETVEAQAAKEPKPKQTEEQSVDKTADKKAKAEAFRKAQEEKK